MALRAVLARSISAIDSEYKRVWQAIDIFIQIYMYLGELTLHGMAWKRKLQCKKVLDSKPASMFPRVYDSVELFLLLE